MTQLTDEQVNSIAKTMEENLHPDLEALREIEKGNIPEELLEEEEEKTQYARVDEHGNIVGYVDPELECDLISAATMEDIDKKMSDPQNVMKAMQKTYDLKHSDLNIANVQTLTDLVKRKEKGDKIYYSDLPDVFKTRIAQTISSEGGGAYMGNKEIKNQMAEALIDNIHMQLISDQMENTVVDMQNSIKNYMTKELGEMFNTSRSQQHKIMIEQMPLLASKTEDPQKADILMKVSDAYKQAYTLEDMFNSYCKGKPKIKSIDVEKIQKHYFTFNDKYHKSKWVIRDVAMLAPILDRNLDKDIDMKDILTFIAIFLKYTEMKNMNPENIWDHTFMYYVVFNIASLDIYKKVDGLNDNDTEFYEGFKSNLNKFFEEIRIRRENK